MFENVVGHGPPVAQLSVDRADGRLPRAILLHGPEYCGKLTIALELARGLTCTAGDAAWNCACRSCRLQRLLIHPDTVMIGPRYFMQEIRVAGDAYSRTPSKPTAYLLHSFPSRRSSDLSEERRVGKECILHEVPWADHHGVGVDQ